MGSMRLLGTILPPLLKIFGKVFVGCILTSSSALADVDGERAVLARLAHELVSLDPLIRTAESHADPNARVHFRYDWLRQDLERVRRGIQDHIDAPRAEPRSFPPLRGNYRQ
jgi:RAQPRD family integrative conjugative element protein